MIGTFIEELFEWIFDVISEKIERLWRRSAWWGRALMLIIFIAAIVGFVMLCQVLAAWVTPFIDPTPVVPTPMKPQ